MTTSHSEMEGAIAAYALDAFAPEERALLLPDLLDHLAGCDPCRVVFGDFRETAGDMALGAAARPVSAEFEARVLGAIRGDARPAPAASMRPRWIVRGLIAASLAAAVGFASLSVAALSDLRQEQRRARRTDRLLTVLGDASAQHLVMKPIRSSGSVALAVASDGRAVLTGSGLPAIARGRVFELWLMDDGAAIPAGVFRADDGDAMLLLDHDPRRYDAAAITTEPGPNGTRSPTSDMIFAVSLGEAGGR